SRETAIAAATRPTTNVRTDAVGVVVAHPSAGRAGMLASATVTIAILSSTRDSTAERTTTETKSADAAMHASRTVAAPVNTARLAARSTRPPATAARAGDTSRWPAGSFDARPRSDAIPAAARAATVAQEACNVVADVRPATTLRAAASRSPCQVERSQPSGPNVATTL